MIQCLSPRDNQIVLTLVPAPKESPLLTELGLGHISTETQLENGLFELARQVAALIHFTGNKPGNNSHEVRTYNFEASGAELMIQSYTTPEFEDVTSLTVQDPIDPNARANCSSLHFQLAFDKDGVITQAFAFWHKPTSGSEMVNSESERMQLMHDLFQHYIKLVTSEVNRVVGNKAT